MLVILPMQILSYLDVTFTLNFVRWHPGSSTDSHLVILTSDEVLRCYDALDGDLLWSCVLSKHSVVSHLNIPSRVSLGDTPVDFDFVSPTINRTTGPESGETCIKAFEYLQLL